MTDWRKGCAAWRNGAGSVSTVLRSGPYRLYFYSHEPNEPALVHVDRGRQTAKLWLAPVSVARNFGFTPRELGTIVAIVVGNEDALTAAPRDA